jgi:hypothetical protein
VISNVRNKYIGQININMKNLLITLGFIGLFAASSSAQDLITREFARKYAGKRVTIWDTVTSVKVINPQYAELTMDKGNPHDQVVIVLKCQDAGRMAKFLSHKVVTAKGLVGLANLGALLQVNNIRDIDEASHIQIDPVDAQKAPKKKQKA